MTESFAQLFEQSLANQRIRPGMILTGLVVDVGDDMVIVNAGLKSEAVIPLEQFKNERGEIEVKAGDSVEVALDAIEDGSGETRLSREKAKRARTWTRLEEAFKKSEIVTGIINGRVKGGFTVEIDNVRAFLPGSLVDVRPVRDTALPRRQGARVQGHQARPEAQQRRRLASRGRRAGILRRAQRAAGEPAGRRRAQGRGQEPHRLRRVRGPRRHRRPAAHHRHGVEARQASVGSRQRRRRDRRPHPQVRPRAPARLARPQAARRGSVGEHRAPLSAEHARCSARSRTSPTTARSSRSRRASKAWSTCPKWTGPTRTSTRPRSCTSARKSKSWCSTSTKSVAASRSASSSASRIRGRSSPRTTTAATRCRARSSRSPTSACSSACRRHRRPRAPVGHLLGRARRRSRAQLPEGPAARGHGAVDRSGARAHLARHQAARARIRSASWIADEPEGHASSRARSRKSTRKGAIIDLGDGIEGQLRASELARDRVEDARTVLKVGEEVEARFTGVDRKTRTIALSIKAKEIHEEAEAVSELPLRRSRSTRHQPRRPAEGTDRRRSVEPVSAVREMTAIHGVRSGPMTKSELIEIITAKQKHLPAKDVELARQADPRDHERRAVGREIASRSAASAASRCTSGRRGRAAIPRPARRWRSSGKYVPHFKPGKDLRERVNDGADRPIRD